MSSNMSLFHGRTDMRLARDLTTNDRLLGQELGAQAAMSQEGGETSQIGDIAT